MYKIKIPARHVDLRPPRWWKFGRLAWRIFGNADDMLPCDWFWPGKNQTLRKWWWLLVRNPMHNFFWYMIGFTHRDRVVWGRNPQAIFIDGWNWHWGGPVGSWVRVPFISYMHLFGTDSKWMYPARFEFYLGWRYAGNFGFKLRMFKV